MLGLAALCAALARPALGSQAFTVGVFLRPPLDRRAALERRATLVSDPGSAEYGKYLSQAEMTEAIGVPQSVAQAAAQWLAAALGGEKEPRVMTHRDVVSLVVSNFSSTYRLGAQLSEACPICAGAPPGLKLPPDTIELLVTPPMPPDFCHGFTKSGKSACNSHRPCKWKHHKAKCRGAFAGWMCWPETVAGTTTRWKCFEPADLLAGNASLPRRRRRGRRWPMVAASADGQASEGSKETEPRASLHLGFAVVPKSEGLLLLFRLNKTTAEKPANKTLANRSKASGGDDPTAWHSLELTFRQEGVYKTKVLRRGDFASHGSRFVGTHIRGLANLRPVDRIAVCLFEDDSAVAETMRSASTELVVSFAVSGCDCDSSRGTDKRLGRKCEVLDGESPANGPVGFVLPRAPQVLSALQRDLGIPLGSRSMSSGSTQAVAEFNDEAFMQKDVVTVHHAFGLRPPPRKIHIQGPDGEPGEGDDFDDAGEGSLDAQVITTLAPGSPTSWVAVDPYVMDGFMLAYAAHVNHDDSPPLVHSVSWGDAEALFPPAFVQRLDYELMKLAMRGLTVIIASGDNGISSTTTDCNFIPDIVGSSPWVTTVGATMPSLSSAPYCSMDTFANLGACEELGPITCATASGAIITSSGYWSIYRSRPSYQDVAVAAYVRDSKCNPCRTNASEDGTEEALELNVPCQHISDEGCRLGPMVGTRRGAPDVALPGNSYPVMINGSLGLEDGTSAAAPALAAMVSLLNSEQLSKGRPPLGLLNPWLYGVHRRHPEAFADVVVGDTGSTEGQICEYGWKAIPGWDLATGLGVPLYAKLREHLPDRGRQAAAQAASTEAVALGAVPAQLGRDGAAGLLPAGWVASSCLAFSLAASAALWISYKRRGLAREAEPFAYFSARGSAGRSLLHD